MADLLFLIPLSPLVGFLILFCTLGNLPRKAVAVVGIGSIAISALITVFVGKSLLGNNIPLSAEIYTWINVGGFAPAVSFYVDGLTLTMMSVITGVGLLIHIYSSEFMWDDKDYSRFFSYMNLFVSAMLVLVLADNLLLLFVGWEGVGLCSYLLVGFWHEDPANGAAARKAFIVTRIGDAAMAIGLFILFHQLGTLDFIPLAIAAQEVWPNGSTMLTIACLLLLGGAVGKSAQLPLQTWLPDAMAGPTPVSALIHAATMVTAGVYLIARTHDLFLLSPTALHTVAVVGGMTLIVAAFTAMTQNDIKRILAYSTISQIGYMFLALGVGAWASSVFHLMTHAFFKALLFLGAGAVIFSLHHEHNILKMGGLRTRLPVAFWSFMIGSAALAALPLTSGFYSKDAILLSAYHSSWNGPLLWGVGLLGALLTSIYSFRLVFLVFFGEIKTEPEAPANWGMAGPLVILCILALAGGLVSIPVEAVFPAASTLDHTGLIPIVTAAIPALGVFIAYLLFLRRSVDISAMTQSPPGKSLIRFFHSHWAMDWLYEKIFVIPYTWLAKINRADFIDNIYGGIAVLMLWANKVSVQTQTGQLRTYAGTMVLGLVLIIALMLGVRAS
ncbi:MAG: NADH-quinone oxidoreductase subunit L [Pseudomonadales bacterium]|nr:NADH-quinone oxidoreductase subunit L [Pseudomonadales bacterium]|tara:strand:+ start:5847 stop:7688 length:1842 start_codon:yes stop_codon:yes gene_type:complete